MSEEKLRAHFARHNRHVLGLTLLTAAAAVAFWTVLYFAMQWLLILALTIADPMNARLPPRFALLFATVAVALCALAWLAGRLDERARDSKSAAEIALEFLLVVPRTTLAVWGNLRALQFLDHHDLPLAQRVLDAIGRAGKLSAQQIPLEIPDPAARWKILLALQITGLVEMVRRDNQLTFVLHEKTPLRTGGPRVRLRVP